MHIKNIPAVTNVVTSAMFSKRFFTAHQWAFALCAWKQLPGWSWDMLCFRCKNRTKTLAERKVSEVVRLWWWALITNCAHSAPLQLLILFFLPLFYVSACLPFICCHSPYHTGSSLCLSHRLPTWFSLSCVRVGSNVSICVFADVHLRTSRLQRTNWDSHPDVRDLQEGNEEAEGDCLKDEMNSLTASACWVFTLNQLSSFDMNSFTTKVCSTAVNMTSDLSCP